MSRSILVTGPIGSGKSAVCAYLASRQYPVYDCDSRCKALYDIVPGLKKRIEDALGVDFKDLGRVIFADDGKREALEAIVYPLLMEDLDRWKAEQKSSLLFIESAVALSKPSFRHCYDSVLLVTAPLELRARRNPKTAERDHLQHFEDAAADFVIYNDSTIERLNIQTEKILIQMKTDLAKILSVSGQHGLYLYLAQARNGVVAETLETRKRTVLDARSRITTLEDIAIYTTEGELKLAEVFTKMKAASEKNAVPTSKSSSDDIKAFFLAAIPDYDGDRFYVSHMKKVLDWYAEIDKFATFDFMTDEDRKAEAEAENAEN